MKNLIRVVVVAGVLAWPAVEVYRIQAAKKQLAESELVGQSISQKLASLQKLQRVPSTEDPASETLPVSGNQTLKSQ
jgi:hypothetical protein